MHWTAGFRVRFNMHIAGPPPVMCIVMTDSPYKREVEIVQRAIGRLRSETDPRLMAELEDEQLAAGTGLEWYGITKGVFERFLASRPLADETRTALQEAVHAVRVIYGSATA